VAAGGNGADRTSGSANGDVTGRALGVGTVGEDADDVISPPASVSCCICSDGDDADDSSFSPSCDGIGRDRRLLRLTILLRFPRL